MPPAEAQGRWGSEKRRERVLLPQKTRKARMGSEWNGYGKISRCRWESIPIPAARNTRPGSGPSVSPRNDKNGDRIRRKLPLFHFPRFTPSTLSSAHQPADTAGKFLDNIEGQVRIGLNHVAEFQAVNGDQHAIILDAN